MNDQILNGIGIAGNALLIASYLPQIRKTIITKKADDLSLLMWICYLAGDLLLLIYAILKNDAIVASLFTVMTIGNVTLLGLTLKYGHVKKFPFGKKKSPNVADTQETVIPKP